MEGQFLIDIESYPLPPENYYETNYKKTQIVLGNTFSTDMNHFIGWKNRLGGMYKRTAAFTVDIHGGVFQHYDPTCSSKFIGNDMDKHSISIAIENEGWLLYDIKNQQHITCHGNIYNRPDEVVKRRWRNFTYWAPYNKKQMESVIELVKYLSDRFNIPVRTLGNNVTNDFTADYEGVVVKGNYGRHFTDLSPAWDFAEFKNKLELNYEENG